MGLTEVRVKLVPGGLVVEAEDNSDPGRCVARFALRDVHRWHLCSGPGLLGWTQRVRLPQATTPKENLGQAAVWVYPWIPVDFQNHSFRELGEFWKRKTIFWALSGKL